jgi:hypothetical protein
VRDLYSLCESGSAPFSKIPKRSFAEGEGSL